jgi:hypothetical protein
MGGEIKRVPMDFDAPVGEPWKGYHCPYVGMECGACTGTGLNPATKEIEESFYDLKGNGFRRWCDTITQDEVEALLAADRLRHWDGKAWVRIARTAEEVNAANVRGGWGDLHHDAINRWILVETRAKRLGVFGHCPSCNGHGDVYCDEKYRALADAWERIEPPQGEGWQLWQTVSDGPISPVFATPDELIDWMCAPVPPDKRPHYAPEAFPRNPWAQGWQRDIAEPFVRGVCRSPVST